VNFDAEVEVGWAFYPCFNPAFNGKAVEAAVDFNRVEALLAIPLERGRYALIPKIAVA